MLSFSDEKVDGPCFLELTDDDLKSVGLKLGTRRKVHTLQKEVKLLKVNNEALKLALYMYVCTRYIFISVYATCFN